MLISAVEAARDRRVTRVILVGGTEVTLVTGG
jgi:hypothetical protein